MGALVPWSQDRSSRPSHQTARGSIGGIDHLDSRQRGMPRHATACRQARRRGDGKMSGIRWIERGGGIAGQTLPLVVIFMMSLLLAAGLTIDVGNAYRVKQSLQA